MSFVKHTYCLTVFHLPAHLELPVSPSHSLGVSLGEQQLQSPQKRASLGKCSRGRADAEIQPVMDELYSNNLQIKIIEVKVCFT